MRRVLATLALLSAPALAQAVVLKGAQGDGVHDDAPAIQGAVDALPWGGTLTIPAGHYVVKSQIVIDKPITLAGAGLGTQIYAPGETMIFSFRFVQGAVVRDLYLGSNATKPNLSLIEFVNSNHNELIDVTMLGGYYGVHYQGSLLNTAIDLRSGANIQGFFAPTSFNRVWVKLDATSDYAPNANTFIAPALEGGNDGLWAQTGSVQIFGGSLEGLAGVALRLQGTFLPSTIAGVDFEDNGQDIVIDASSNVKIETVNSVPRDKAVPPASLALGEIAVLGDSRNIQISDSNISSLAVANSAKRVHLQNTTFGTATGFCDASVVLKLPAPTATDVALGTVSNELTTIDAANVGNYCGGQ